MKMLSTIEEYMNEVYGFSFDEIPENFHRMLCMILDDDFAAECPEFFEYGIYSEEESSLMNMLLRTKRLSAPVFLSQQFKETWKTDALEEWLKK